MPIDWTLIETREADALHDTIVEMEGWAMPLDPTKLTTGGVPRLRAMLALPLLGAGEVTVHYELPTPSVPPVPRLKPITRSTVVRCRKRQSWKRSSTSTSFSAIS